MNSNFKILYFLILQIIHSSYSSRHTQDSSQSINQNNITLVQDNSTLNNNLSNNITSSLVNNTTYEVIIETSACKEITDCFNCTMFSQSNIICQWNLNKCEDTKKVKNYTNWWDYFYTCVMDSSSYNRMRKFCGAILEQTPPLKASTVNLNGLYGTSNLYCRWNAFNIDITRVLLLNLTKFTPAMNDLYTLEIFYHNGFIDYRKIDQANYFFSDSNIDSVYLHYYSSQVYHVLPFSASFNYQLVEVTANYFNLFIALGVTIISCVLGSFIFYKCSRVIIQNSNRNLNQGTEMNERDQNSQAIDSPNNRNQILTREEELRYKNAEKLNSLFENELKPIRYNINLNEFEGNCTICMEDFKMNVWVILLFCRHVFHIRCLEKWCVKTILHPKCPNCNYSMIPYKEDELGMSILRIYHDNRRNNSIIENIEENRVEGNQIEEQINNNINHENINNDMLLRERLAIDERRNPDLNNRSMNLSNIDIREINIENRHLQVLNQNNHPENLNNFI